MVQQIKWTDISFDGNMPVGKFPALVERLAGMPARLEEKIKNTPFLILTQPYNGGWSIQEHIGHLTDLEELIIKRLDDFKNGLDVLTAADMSNKKTYDANYNQHDINTILKNFRAARMTTVKQLRACDENFIVRTALLPTLKMPMRCIDMIHIFAEHDDHHLAAISYLAVTLP